MAAFIAPFNPLSLLVLKFRDRSVAVFRDPCLGHEGILGVAQRTFRHLQGVPPEDIVLLAAIPGYPESGEVELSKDIWPMVSAGVHSVTIALESEMRSSNECNSPVPPDYKEVRAENANSGTGDPPEPPLLFSSPPLQAPHSMPSPTRWHHLRRGPPEQPSDAAQTSTASGVLAPVRTSPGSRTTRVRKPIIYLYPPSSLPDVTVELQLASSWSFSAVYPPPQAAIPSGGHQTTQSRALTWAVAAEPSGTLVDKTSGTEVSYLYWEAIANTQPVTPNSSRETTPVGDIEAFDPSRPSVTPGDSVLLPIGKIPGYLDEVLKALALHTEARTSFITYWLPDLLKHEYVALRFLPQASYEQAAQMRISPAPDVVTRIFMLFRGVPTEDLGLWERAATRATAADGGAAFWTRVVGIDPVRASDRDSFRVLEWGGLEIK